MRAAAYHDDFWDLGILGAHFGCGKFHVVLGVMNAGVHPHYGVKATLIILVTLCDLAINTFADHNDYTGNGRWFLAVLFRYACFVDRFPPFSHALSR